MTDEAKEAETLQQAGWVPIYVPFAFESPFNVWLLYRPGNMRLGYGQPWTEEGRKKFHETLASAPKGRSLNMTKEDAAFVKAVMCGEEAKEDH